jgi:hypothetical protein
MYSKVLAQNPVKHDSALARCTKVYPRAKMYTQAVTYVVAMSHQVNFFSNRAVWRYPEHAAQALMQVLFLTQNNNYCQTTISTRTVIINKCCQDVRQIMIRTFDGSNIFSASLKVKKVHYEM